MPGYEAFQPLATENNEGEENNKFWEKSFFKKENFGQKINSIPGLAESLASSVDVGLGQRPLNREQIATLVAKDKGLLQEIKDFYESEKVMDFDQESAHSEMENLAWAVIEKLQR